MYFVPSQRYHLPVSSAMYIADKSPVAGNGGFVGYVNTRAVDIIVQGFEVVVDVVQHAVIRRIDQRGLFAVSPLLDNVVVCIPEFGVLICLSFHAFTSLGGS